MLFQPPPTAEQPLPRQARPASSSPAPPTFAATPVDVGETRITDSTSGTGRPQPSGEEGQPEPLTVRQAPRTARKATPKKATPAKRATPATRATPAESAVPPNTTVEDADATGTSAARKAPARRAASAKATTAPQPLAAKKTPARKATSPTIPTDAKPSDTKPSGVRKASARKTTSPESLTGEEQTGAKKATSRKAAAQQTATTTTTTAAELDLTSSTAAEADLTSSTAAGRAEDDGGTGGVPEVEVRALVARVLDHPGFAPELLALTAVEVLGPRAAEWARRLRETYPGASADGLARLAGQRFLRQATVGGAGAALAGAFAPVVELAVVLWSQASLVLHLAAAYGRDPAHPDRAAELLVLTLVHPDLEAARSALAAARAADGPGEEPGPRAVEAAWRLAAPLTAQAGGWLALRLASRLIPGAAPLAAAVTTSTTTQRLTARALTAYRPPRSQS